MKQSRLAFGPPVDAGDNVGKSRKDKDKVDKRQLEDFKENSNNKIDVKTNKSELKAKEKGKGKGKGKAEELVLDDSDSEYDTSRSLQIIADSSEHKGKRRFEEIDLTIPDEEDGVPTENSSVVLKKKKKKETEEIVISDSEEEDDYSLANHSKSTREPLSPRKMFTSSSSNQTKKPPSLFSSFTPPQDPISTSKKFFTKSEKARGKERAVEEPVEEVVEENDWDDMEWETITPSTSKPTSAPSTSTSSFAYGGGGGGGNPKKKQSKLAFTSFFATPSASSSKASTSKSASTSSSTSSSFKGKNKGKGNESEPFKESVPVFLSDLEDDDELRVLCVENQEELERKCQEALQKKKKLEEELDLSYQTKADQNEAKKLAQKGKKVGNERWKRMVAARTTLREQQKETFEKERSEVFGMLRENLDLCKRSLDEISLDDTLVQHFKEMSRFADHKFFITKTQTTLVWYLLFIDPRILAGIANHLLSSPNAIHLLEQLRTGSPDWEKTLDSLPEVTPDMENLLIYILSTYPSDIDGPLPLVGSETSKKIGFTVDPKKRQVYAGSAFAGATKVNEELRKKGVTTMGRMLPKVRLEKGAKSTKTGGGLRVCGQHLSQKSRLTIKLSQNARPFVASSESYKARYGIPDDSPEAFESAVAEGRKTIKSNSNSKIPFDSSQCPPRAFAFVDNAPSVVGAAMEALVIVGGQLASRSTLYLDAAKDLGIRLLSKRPFESRNKELGIEDRSTSFSDPESQRARGIASRKKQWKRIENECSNVVARAAWTNKVIRDRNLLAWVNGYDSYLHWSGRGTNQRKPELRVKLCGGAKERKAALANNKRLNGKILAKYPEGIPSTKKRDGRERTQEEEEQARALINDHVPSTNRFIPLFPDDRDSLPVERYDYKFTFQFRGKEETCDLELKKRDLTKPTAKALEWFTPTGCSDLDLLAIDLARRIRTDEKEALKKEEELLESLEVEHNPEEEDEGDLDDEDDNEDDDEEETGSAGGELDGGTGDFDMEEEEE